MFLKVIRFASPLYRQENVFSREILKVHEAQLLYRTKAAQKIALSQVAHVKCIFSSSKVVEKVLE